MNKKLIGSLLLLVSFVCAMPACAINIAADKRAAWGYDGGTATNGAATEFILAGGIGKSGQHGTYGDEWGLVGMVASTIVEHGGYFCPYQVQCANKRKKKKTWTEYYKPNGFSTGKCAWLCETGYTGTNCMQQDTAPVMCDTKSYTKTSGGKFTGLSMKTSGERNGMCETEIFGFNQWGSDPECDVVLGIVKFLEHGVIAGPVQICCGRDNWRSIDSFVKSVSMATGSQKLLCAEGYKANSAGNDCEPISPDLCATQGMTFCANFPRTGYNSSIHSLSTEGSCVKYFCSEPGKAFAEAGSTECSECSTGVKGGSSTANGLCVRCESGQYFDQKTNSCQSAAAYTKIDLQYGKGQTKNTTKVSDQCWTLTTPEEYRACVAKRNG